MPTARIRNCLSDLLFSAIIYPLWPIHCVLLLIIFLKILQYITKWYSNTLLLMVKKSPNIFPLVGCKYVSIFPVNYPHFLYSLFTMNPSHSLCPSTMVSLTINILISLRLYFICQVIFHSRKKNETTDLYNSVPLGYFLL